MLNTTFNIDDDSKHEDYFDRMPYNISGNRFIKIGNKF